MRTCIGSTCHNHINSITTAAREPKIARVKGSDIADDPPAARSSAATHRIAMVQCTSAHAACACHSLKLCPRTSQRSMLQDVPLCHCQGLFLRDRRSFVRTSGSCREGARHKRLLLAPHHDTESKAGVCTYDRMLKNTNTSTIDVQTNFSLLSM